MVNKEFFLYLFADCLDWALEHLVCLNGFATAIFINAWIAKVIVEGAHIKNTILLFH